MRHTRKRYCSWQLGGRNATPTCCLEVDTYAKRNCQVPCMMNDCKLFLLFYCFFENTLSFARESGHSLKNRRIFVTYIGILPLSTTIVITRDCFSLYCVLLLSRITLSSRNTFELRVLCSIMTVRIVQQHETCVLFLKMERSFYVGSHAARQNEQDIW
jgi:hypothetical protein